MKLSDVMRLGSNAMKLRNVIRLDNVIRLNNAIGLRARQRGEDLKLLGYYKRVMVINKWLLFKTAIRQKDKVLFHSWERLYIYDISGHIIIVYSVKRFNIKI